MTAYYNENNPAMAAWLRALIHCGLVAAGEVDERSIEDVSPADLWGYDQHHFFAGIGGWSCALRLAGWPDDRPVWTGSCPCQPFSQAGRRLGFADQRHLWPAWHWLIQQCRPATVFGEQVGRVGGARWLDLVFGDLEALDYACGATVLPACGVGAPHLRQRVFWLANADGQGLSLGSQSKILVGVVWDEGSTTGKGGLVRNPWLGCDWIRLTDGSVRSVEPGTHPLAHGVPARVVKLCGYGNALVPQVAAEFVKAVMEHR
ncbi:MAG: DNA cytosine methyltransferase [Magnetococcales bacterium]|nr:DNA cytosine methyltransferase [Magnetococcales bacterium]